MLTTREALEAALVRSPDDLTLHMAYADCLMEEGDPRGDFIRCDLIRRERCKTQKQRKIRAAALEQFLELRNRHEGEWLGDLKPYAYLSNGERPVERVYVPLSIDWEFGWAKGFSCWAIQPAMFELMKSCKVFKLLDRFSVSPGVYQHLIASDYHRELNVHEKPHRSYDYLKSWIDYPLKFLHISDMSLGLDDWDAIFRAPCFPSMLLGVESCGITDEIAIAIAPRLRERPPGLTIHAESNFLTRTGIAALNSTGHTVYCKNQHTVTPPQ